MTSLIPDSLSGVKVAACYIYDDAVSAVLTSPQSPTSRYQYFLPIQASHSLCAKSALPQGACQHISLPCTLPDLTLAHVISSVWVPIRDLYCDYPARHRRFCEQKIFFTERKART